MPHSSLSCQIADAQKIFNWRKLPASSCLGSCKCLTIKYSYSGKTNNSDSLVAYVIHQELWHERVLQKVFRELCSNIWEGFFYSFPTKMQLNCPRFEISSHVDVCSNISIMTWGEHWIFWGWQISFVRLLCVLMKEALVIWAKNLKFPLCILDVWQEVGLGI